jgi:hypothetical protein
MFRVVTFIAICLPAIVSVSAQGSPEIRVVGGELPTAVEVTGLSKNQLADLATFADSDERWPTVLAVYVVEKEAAIQPITGKYSLDQTTLRFTPRYSLRPGMHYRVLFHPLGTHESAAVISKNISIAAAPIGEPTRVTAIYPSASTLPDNQLRFYLHFSAPMAAGTAYEHVKLLKANGDVVSRAFLEIGEELWDGTGQRLTLLFDPGRVKKGLSPRLQFGPVLEAGNSYRLVIDKAWRDANGQPLAASFEKAFTAGPAVETAVDFKQWKIMPPATGTRDSLVIQFPRSLDRALLMRMISVADASGKEIAGEITLGDDERRWEFRPEQPLAAGNYTLVVDTALVDSAGNNLARPFDVDVFDRVDDKPGPELVRIPFAIK